METVKIILYLYYSRSHLDSSFILYFDQFQVKNRPFTGIFIMNKFITNGYKQIQTSNCQKAAYETAVSYRAR